MEFINATGRTEGTGIQPAACMCSSGFAIGKGNDSCYNCGCRCDSDGSYKTGNNVNATMTFRAS